MKHIANKMLANAIAENGIQTNSGPNHPLRILIDLQARSIHEINNALTVLVAEERLHPDAAKELSDLIMDSAGKVPSELIKTVEYRRRG